MAASLLKLLDHLNFVAGDVVFIQQINVLNATIVKDKVVNIVIVDFAGFIQNGVTRLIQISLHKTPPLTLGKLHVIQRLQLLTHIGQHGLRVIQAGQIFIALVLQILNKLTL